MHHCQIHNSRNVGKINSVNQKSFNTLRTGVRYIRTSISAKKQQFSVALPTP